MVNQLTNKKVFWFIIPLVLMGVLPLLAGTDLTVWPQRIIGTICYLFVPGFFLSFVLFPAGRVNLFERLSLATAFSILIPPIIIYFSHRLWPEQLPLNFETVYLLTAALTVIWGALALIRWLYLDKGSDKEAPIGVGLQITRRELFWLAVVFVIYAVMTAIFISRHPYIITPDANYFHTIIREAVETGVYPAYRPQVFPFYPERYEPLMQSGAIAWSLLANIDPAVIVRFGITLLTGIFMLPIYLLAKELTNNKPAALFSLAVGLSTPVLMTSLAVGRPQSLLFFISPLIIYSLVRFAKAEKINQYLWLAVWAILFILSWRIHNLFVLMVPVILVAVFWKYWDNFKRRPWHSLATLLLLGVLLYPYLRDLGVLARVGYFWKEITTKFVGFNLLNNPFSIVTYGANYAFLLIPLSLGGVYLLLRQQAKFFDRTVLFITLAFALVYFFFLEVLPRIGYYFLPERSFPHLAIGLIILSAIPIKWLIEKGNKILNAIFALLLAGSFGATIYVNQLPAFHTISAKEVEAVHYLNDRQENILVLTQKANVPMIRQFGDFKVFSPTDKTVISFFQAENSEDAYSTIKKFGNYQAVLTARMERSKQRIAEAASDQNISDSRSFVSSSQYIARQFSILRSLYLDRENMYEWTGSLNDSYSMYVVYSFVKDKSFHNRSAYWQEDNFIGVDLTKFDDTKYFEKVFSNSDVAVWRIKL